MSKRTLTLVAGALLLAFAAYAGDVWKDKDFKDWDQKDIQKIMTDSPWVKHIDSGSGGGGGAGGSSSAPVTEVGRGNLPDTGQRGDMGSNGGTVGGGRGADVAPKAGGGGGPLGGSYVIQWASSRTMREAIARNRELSGISPDDARKDLNTVPEGYVILLRGSNLGAFAHTSQDDLIQGSYLELKSSKVKITALKVIPQSGQEGGRPTVVIFQFPRKTPTGEPTIPADEKGVNFVTKIGKVELKVGFDISKMADKQGLDL